MITFKIQIAETKAGNQHRVNGQDEFNSISDAIRKALSERERMLLDYGILEEKAKENEWDLNWCYENCKVQLELQKWDDEDGIQEITAEDYNGVDAELMKEFESKFQTTGWANCLTDFFHYSK
jgi:Arc/MetJ-type ribon-helix-helix transcriptional regulator